MRNVLSWAAKLGFSAVVLGVLIWKANREALFQTLSEHEKDWRFVGCAVIAYFLTIFIQVFRWRLLVLALRIRMSLADGLRLGFLSQLFSLLGLGMLGGDALKTYFLGKQNGGRMTEAFTSVFVDRLLGLYGLVVMAALISAGFDRSSLNAGDASLASTAVLRLCQWLPWAAGVGTLGLVVLMLPGVTTWPAWDLLAEIPLLGKSLKKIVAALRMYQAAPGSMGIATLLSFLVHLCNGSILYFLSLALPAYHGEMAVEKPGMIAHLTAALLSLATGALPVGGLEMVFNGAYQAISPPEMPREQGFLLILAFRLIQMAVATIGLYYYLRGRREVDELMHEAQEATHTPTTSAEPNKRHPSPAVHAS